MRADVVLLCGGRGSRLGALTAETPKPLLPVGGSPFLLHLLRRLQGEGFCRFILAAHYLPDRFREFVLRFRDSEITSGAASSSRSHDQMDLELIVEPEPLGTGGALAAAAKAVRTPHFLAMNGDTWISQPMKPVLAQHDKEGRVFTAVASAVDRLEGANAQKGVWRIGPEGQFLGFGTEDRPTQGWINAGIYLLERNFVMTWPSGSYSLEHRFSRLLAGKKAGIFCSKETLVDIGTPEVYARAEEFVTGSVGRPAVSSR